MKNKIDTEASNIIPFENKLKSIMREFLEEKGSDILLHISLEKNGVIDFSINTGEGRERDIMMYRHILYMLTTAISKIHKDIEEKYTQ